VLTLLLCHCYLYFNHLSYLFCAAIQTCQPAYVSSEREPVNYYCTTFLGREQEAVTGCGWPTSGQAVHGKGNASP